MRTGIQNVDPTLVSALVTAAAGLLMVQAGIAKKRLSRRPVAQRVDRRRRPLGRAAATFRAWIRAEGSER
jgi:hypothetical protein